MNQLLCVVAFLAVAQAQFQKSTPAEEFDPNPSYSFSYDIQDSVSGDFKSQSESRDGDVVQGSYSLIEPDGSKRIVDYSADAVNGFNAVVRKEVAGAVAKTVPVKPVVVAKAAPLPLTLTRAPFAYAPTPSAYAPRYIALAHAAAPLALSHAPLAAPAVAHSSLSSPYYSYTL